MKKIVLLFALVLSVSVFASKKPDWKLPIEGKPIAIFKHNFTGIPIVETTKFFYGVNYVEKSILWTVEKKAGQEALKNATEVASMTGVGTDVMADANAVGAVAGFQEIPFTPFVSIHNKFADVGTGNILIGAGEDAYSAIESHDILPELYKLLVKVKAEDGSRKLYCIDLNSRQVEWKQTLALPNGSKDAMKMVSSAAMGQMIFNAFSPKVTAKKEIVYKNESDLFLINSSNGEIIWKNECKPGTFFLDDAQNTLVVINQASAAGNYLTAKGASFGKSMFALDLKNGKELWSKPVKLDSKFAFQVNYDADNFVVAHEKGINIFDFKTGTAKWKKDYETKRIQEVTVKDKGVEVFYGNRIMLVDVSTGKKAWKKPIQFDDVPEDEEGSMIKKDYEKGVFIVGTSFAGLFNRETGKKIWKMGISDKAKAAFDERNNKVAILDWKKLYLFDPNTVEKKPEKIKLDINKPDEIIGFETFEAGYFVTGMNEFFMLDQKGNPISTNYFKPLKTDRLLKAALATANVASGIMATEVVVSDSEGNEVYSGGLFMSTENAKAMGDISDATGAAVRKLKEAAKLRGAARSSRDYAFFLKGEKIESGDKMSIVKISKTTGKQEDAFDFGENRSVIFELDKMTNKLYYLDENQINVFDLN
ncbi:PQQ-binding-like beta-propeller repeat protein [Carboxylicivirga sp. M1479]|uniref:outer membrane protein assembly factor BamB family protein n=1 Tax=Carboxylicivirga sp. M1479 TaxID=2594476 RepID=UPI001178683F|nr:PQQ-binding-like beta-propeller repeat protein [Carboxylicivirga sp. M1479]TRX72374.1 PQQ-binding-like beta-propeller repeat protein [Carboxylicivirga sp. M1479]